MRSVIMLAIPFIAPVYGIISIAMSGGNLDEMARERNQQPIGRQTVNRVLR